MVFKAAYIIVVSAIVLLFVNEAAAQCAGGACTTVTSVDQTFALGTRWRFDVERCPCEGLILRNIRFTPKNGVERKILHRAGIAQLHIPYDPGTPRYHDLTTSTYGMGASASTLTVDECDGTRYDGNRVCIGLHDRGHAWKYGSQYKINQEVTVMMASTVSLYTYINEWHFLDDGTIEPRLGMTGYLVNVSQDPTYETIGFGSRLNAQGASPPSIGVHHLHNIYYRLDFDIGDSSSDAVDRVEYLPHSSVPNCQNAGQCGKEAMTRRTTEGPEYIDPERFTSWRVFDKVTTNADGRNIGYEIVPEYQGLWTGMTLVDEPWAKGELWVTAYNNCELFAFDNVSPYISGCPGAAQDLGAMSSQNSNVDGADIVVWYVLRHRHFVRDEDSPEMPVDWVGFEMKPRSFNYQTPFD